LTLRIHYLKDEQTSGYYHQFRGTYVQVFNTSVMFLKTMDQINGKFSFFCLFNFIENSIDYVKTIGQMIVSIINSFAQKSINLNEKTLNRYTFFFNNQTKENLKMLIVLISMSKSNKFCCLAIIICFLFLLNILIILFNCLYIG